MSFRIGLVGLCSSHPYNWVPTIRELVKEGLVDAEVVVAWDSGETRPEGFAADFCKEFNIPKTVDRLEDMIDMVDGVIIHTSNWDRHVEQANPFINAGKSVLIDKPQAGNIKGLNQILAWAAQGKRITGGSSLRFCAEAMVFAAIPEAERGRLHTAYSAIGTDDFNYGIHGYAMLSALMGPGVVSVQYLGFSGQKQLKIKWKNGNVAFLTFGENAWLPFNVVAVTDKQVKYFQADTAVIYRNLLVAELPYFCGKTDTPPMPMTELLEPEMTALAARMSWMHNGGEVFLTDLRVDDPGYDGNQFAAKYRRSRGI